MREINVNGLRVSVFFEHGATDEGYLEWATAHLCHRYSEEEHSALYWLQTHEGQLARCYQDRRASEKERASDAGITILTFIALLSGVAGALFTASNLWDWTGLDRPHSVLFVILDLGLIAASACGTFYLANTLAMKFLFEAAPSPNEARKKLYELGLTSSS